MRLRFWFFRHVVQLGFFALFNAAVLSIIYPEFRFSQLNLPLPILVGLTSPFSTVYDAFDVIQVMLARPEIPFAALSVLFIVGAVVGKAFCGWVCPIGFIQDLLTGIKGRPSEIQLETHRQLLRLKFFVLGVTLLVSCTLAVSLAYGKGLAYKLALGVFAFGPYLALSPDETLFGALPKLLVGGQMIKLFSGDLTVASTVGWLQLAVLLLFLYGSIRVSRFWCRYVCPTGALMGIFNRFSFLGMRREPVKCAKCPHCVKSCPMQIRILDLPWEKFNHPECIACLECADACPHRAIGLKFP